MTPEIPSSEAPGMALAPARGPRPLAWTIAGWSAMGAILVSMGVPAISRLGEYLVSGGIGPIVGLTGVLVALAMLFPAALWWARGAPILRVAAWPVAGVLVSTIASAVEAWLVGQPFRQDVYLALNCVLVLVMAYRHKDGVAVAPGMSEDRA